MRWISFSKEKVVEICGFLCGIIREKEDSMMADIKFINDATLASLHEDRMMRMMICDALMYSKAWHDTSLARAALISDICHEVESELFVDLIKDLKVLV